MLGFGSQRETFSIPVTSVGGRAALAFRLGHSRPCRLSFPFTRFCWTPGPWLSPRTLQQARWVRSLLASEGDSVGVFCREREKASAVYHVSAILSLAHASRVTCRLTLQYTASLLWQALVLSKLNTMLLWTSPCSSKRLFKEAFRGRLLTYRCVVSRRAFASVAGCRPVSWLHS